MPPLALLQTVWLLAYRGDVRLRWHEAWQWRCEVLLKLDESWESLQEGHGMEGDDPLQQQRLVGGIPSSVQATDVFFLEGVHLAKQAEPGGSTAVLWRIDHQHAMFLERDYHSLHHLHQGVLHRLTAKLQQLFQSPI
jgi:hypothetical protein